MTPSEEHGPSRRGVLAGGAAGAAIVASPAVAAGPTPAGPATMPVSLVVNGERHALTLDTRTTLLDTFREHLHLTGTKKGCDHGQCGACTVIINGERINSCLSLAVQHQGDQVTTIEGLGTPERLHPMQAAFIKHDGYQCGYCTPGQICSAVAVLKELANGVPSHVQAGVSLDQVVVRLGDSTFPESPGSGGQWGAASATSGVYAACVKLREAVAQALGFDVAEVEFVDGLVRSGDHRAKLADAARAGELVGEDQITYGDLSQQYAQQTFGAHFVELGVHADTGEIRLRRMLAVCHAGRILNPKSARSQVIGAMTMGAGAALMEEMAVDTRLGFFVNHDLATYEVPVHADVPHQEVIFLADEDPTMSPMKAKGVGELGLCGVAAAIANAVYNATGARVRDYPVTLDKILDRLPTAA